MQTKYKVIWILIVLIMIEIWPKCLDSRSMGTQKVATFKNNPYKSLSSRYLIFLPPEYHENQRKWPLLIFLHGGSARGSDINKLRRYVLPGYLDKGIYPTPDFPFIVVSPQYRRGKTWQDNAKALSLLIKEVCLNFKVDDRRIYLTGPSMGGQGTWYIASQYPNLFAAIAPVAAVRTVPEWASQVKRLPVWIFQGKRDKFSPLKSFKVLVKKIGQPATCKITVYDKDHVGTIKSAYKSKELYAWFLKHRKENAVQGNRYG
jgi:predicted peptidase